jgi:hypothetical protein
MHTANFEFNSKSAIQCIGGANPAAVQVGDTVRNRQHQSDAAGDYRSRASAIRQKGRKMFASSDSGTPGP